MWRSRKFRVAVIAASLVLTAAFVSMLFVDPPKRLYPHLPFEAPIEQQIETQISQIGSGQDADLPLPIVVNDKSIKNLHYDVIQKVLIAEGFTEKSTYWEEYVNSAIFTSPDHSIQILWEPSSGCCIAENIVIRRIIAREPGVAPPIIEIGIDGFQLGEQNWQLKDQNNVMTQYDYDFCFQRGAYSYMLTSSKTGELEKVEMAVDNGADNEFIADTGGPNEERVRQRVEFLYGVRHNFSTVERLKDWWDYIHSVF